MIILGVNFCGGSVSSATDSVIKFGEKTADFSLSSDSISDSFSGWSIMVRRSPSLTDCLEGEDDLDGRDDVLLVTGLSNMKKNAEARLWAKRQARAEAREIRMRELERIQREQEENADRQFDMLAAATTEPPPLRGRPSAGAGSGRHRPASRRSSEDSLEDGGGGGGGSLRELRHELKEVEEKFRKAMIANAQLDNDKTSQTYQLELLKDKLEELEEEHSQLKREHRDKCREHDQLKRLCAQLKDDVCALKYELDERDRLIAEKGLVLIIGEPGEDGEPPKKALVQADNAKLLEEAGDGSLDVRLAKFAKEKIDLQDQISSLKLKIEEERNRRRKSSSSGLLNGPSSDYDLDDLQREASKQLADYKFRAQKAEQDVATLQATVARLESQVIRYKTAAEVSEQSEEALKSEKRKLQREVSNLSQKIMLLEASTTALKQQQKRLYQRTTTGSVF
ncbi:leucine-rich repeat flightless-interacting protein 2 isoform X2 [Sitophilus oryzae]|uniref:Leucine-rich repeat flightless-interacting protein 2 isoform X2 n=1 Tax=Sitophilus oryzae TaxID=7048 RepID=A0A6J2XEY3_SITOR|nr:leucine-rich repeat flightless-interacting protein 2 isoform X2 [Sitophilus oryzae]XP_030749904.1 leucine-rich repeat flightless-interacting protein 2 isoform X2 [Sitophilus oryzae]